jgi:hypothetical protein
MPIVFEVSKVPMACASFSYPFPHSSHFDSLVNIIMLSFNVLISYYTNRSPKSPPPVVIITQPLPTHLSTRLLRATTSESLTQILTYSMPPPRPSPSASHEASQNRRAAPALTHPSSYYYYSSLHRLTRMVMQEI